MRASRLISVALVAALWCSAAFAEQITVTPAGSGGGSGTVTNIATGCALTGGPITGTGTIAGVELVNAQSGTSYAFQGSDCGKLVTTSNGSAIAATIAQAGTGSFTTGWFVDVQNKGAGSLTITPATSTINGAATLVLATNQGARIVSDGTNYQIQSGIGGNNGTVTSITTSCGVSGGPITTSGQISSTAAQRNVTATTDTITSADCGNVVTESNASPVAVAITTAGFATGNYFSIKNKGAGLATYTPSSGTIDGSATLACAQNQSADIIFDGTNYIALGKTCGLAGASGANPSATASDTAVNGAASTFMRSDAAPAVQKGSNAQFGLAEGDGASIDLTAGVVSRRALTGDVTAPAGSAATTLAAGNAGNLNSGTLNAARMPALTGDCTTVAGAVATTCLSPHPGYITSAWYFGNGPTLYSTGSAATANRISCYYTYFSILLTVRNVGVGIVGAGSSNLQIALYKNSGGNPGALIDSTPNMLDTGAAATVTGALAGNQQLGPGSTNGRDIWVCSNQNDSTVTYRAVANAQTYGGIYQGSATLGNILGSGAITAVAKLCAGANCNGGSSTFNTWPATLFGSTWTDQSGQIAPLVAVQVVSSP